MTAEELWKDFARNLLRELQEKGLLQSQRLQEVFWKTPRHRFIDELYSRQPDELGWRRRPAPSAAEDDADWLASIYQDVPLIVRIDEQGMPTCSNSAPSLVLRMLDLLDVSAGTRVLEIGTGTGQLTAILAHIAAEEGEVTSLELQSDLAHEAQARLKALDVKFPVSIVEADASSWDGSDRSFDAIVATASCWPVPATWLGMLAPGGRICVDLRGRLSGGVLLARRQQGANAGVTEGTFVAEQSGFMPLKIPSAGVGEAMMLPFGMGEDEDGRLPAQGLGEKQLFEKGFDWFCQLEMPDAAFAWIPVSSASAPQPFLLADDGLDVVKLPVDGSRADSQLVSYGGTSSLMARLLASWSDWHRCHRPTHTDYSFIADSDRSQRVSLEDRRKSWILAQP